ncbi:unnamed protein product [Closterium sp. NIES-53]
MVEDIDSFLRYFNALVIAAGESGELPQCASDPPPIPPAMSTPHCMSPIPRACSYGSPMVEDIDSFLRDFNALVIVAPHTLTKLPIPHPPFPPQRSYGSPMVEDIDSFLRDFNALVSSPGAERVVKVPDDLIRFKELPMYVHYRLPSEADNTGDKEANKGDLSAGGSTSAVAPGGKTSEEILSLLEVDEEERVTVWRVADVRLNRELYGGKGRPLSRKNRERRITVPFSDFLQPEFLGITQIRMPRDVAQVPSHPDFHSRRIQGAARVSSLLKHVLRPAAYECFGSKSQDAPGEDYSAIIYNRDQVEVMESGNFWLSETPEVCGSTSWGASTPAVVNWVKFRVKGLQPPGYAFQAYNVRMKTGSSSARAKGALLLWQHISSVPPSIPALMCANFNQNKGSATARFFLGSWKLNGIEGDFKDVLSIARKKINTGHIYSHHRFQGHDMSCLQIVKSAMEICTAESDPGIVDPLHTDWMFRYGRALNPTYCEVVVSSWGGKLPTSHYPLYAEFSLPRSVQAAQ